MLFSSSFLSAAAFSVLAHAADHVVKVGSGGNKFNPNTVQAAVGDTVTFQWQGSTHDLIEASFDKPCAPLAGGFAVPDQSSSSAVFTLDVTSTDPMWFYCSVSLIYIAAPI
jgi:plastocyanin